MPNTLNQPTRYPWSPGDAPATGIPEQIVGLITEFAQDQANITIDRGRGTEDWYGVRRSSNKDAQSDAGGSIVEMPPADILGALHRAVRARREGAWPTPEVVLGTEASRGAESQSGDTEHDEQSGTIHDIAGEWTADRLAVELLELDTENDWPRLRELILTAEDFGFTAERSARLAPRLLDLAVQYRDSNDPQDAPPVLSAIRTGASMLRPNEASRLLALLEPGHPIETSLVALKMLGRIFEAQPPEGTDQHTELAREVRGIAELLLNPYAIASSKSAAMAQLAVYALAAMASSETVNIAGVVGRMDVSWFGRQTARELRELRDSWDARSVSVAPAVLELLDRATREMQTT